MACIGEKNDDTRKVLMFQVEGKKAFERPVHRWEYTTAVDLKQIWWEGVHLICVAQDRVKWRPIVNTVNPRRVP